MSPTSKAPEGEHPPGFDSWWAFTESEVWCDGNALRIALTAWNAALESRAAHTPEPAGALEEPQGQKSLTDHGPHGGALAAPPAPEGLQEVLDKIENWSKAYPLDIFPRPDLKRTAEVLEAAGLTIDSLSADSMRHIITQVWEMLAPFSDTQRSVAAPHAPEPVQPLQKMQQLAAPPTAQEALRNAAAQVLIAYGLEQFNEAALSERFHNAIDYLHAALAAQESPQPLAPIRFKRSKPSHNAPGWVTFTVRLADADRAEAALAAQEAPEPLRVAACQASFCLRQLLPNDPDAQMTVRMLEAALRVVGSVRAEAAQEAPAREPNLRGAFDGSPEAVILSLRANLRTMTDFFEMLLDDGKFPNKSRTIDGKEADAQWWEDRYAYIKQARIALALEVSEWQAALAPSAQEALREAIDVIRGWHGEIAWDIYFEQSPEMKRIRAALAAQEAPPSTPPNVHQSDE